MFKLLIVDDEPLVQIGIKSMLDWESLGITICQTAMNGKAALDLIEEYSPEIVIADIKMPIMNGLELVRICKERFGQLPLFIILTSYEEFSLVKEAIHYQVVDYLVKIELDPESLEASVKKTLDILQNIQKSEPGLPDLKRPILQSFQDKFFMRLLYNLFENEEQFRVQCKDLKLDFSYQGYIAAHCAFFDSHKSSMTSEKQINLYMSALQMVKELLVKYMDCYLFPLDVRHFCIIFYLEEDNTENNCHAIQSALDKTYSMINKYFNVTVLTGIGRSCDSPFLISESYQDARQVFNEADSDHPIVFYQESTNKPYSNKSFNIAMFRNDITKGFEEFDTDVLYKTFTEIAELFRMHPNHYLQAVDGSCNILYLAISLLPEGEKIVSGIFENYPGGYRSIYLHTNVEQVIEWFLTFRDGLCEVLNVRKKSYKNRIVSSVEKYICNHINEKLTLNDTAAVFGITPNYLSVLFKKHGEMGFSEYITQQKIKKAKELMKNPDLKVYEIAGELGFDSAFYFSKVFKKVEGVSPRVYQQQIHPVEM